MQDKRLAFSLLELMIYMGLLAVVMIVIMGIFVGIGTGRGKSEAQTAVNSNLRFAFQEIQNDLRAATAVTTPASAGATSTTLSLDASNTITYCVVGGVLLRQIGTATTTVLNASSATYITAGTFNWLAPTNILQNATVTVEAWGGGGAGGGSQTTNSTGGGGAGGSYSILNSTSVTPGTTYSGRVAATTAGTTGNGTQGASSSFNGATAVAVGGPGGTGNITSGSSGGASGTTSGNVGDNFYIGGDGGNAYGTAQCAGGGGGGAGSTGKGGNGSVGDPGTGTSVGGGAGGPGTSSTYPGFGGSAGSQAGGGGSGAAKFGGGPGQSGGTGAAGQVKLSYYTASVSSSSGCNVNADAITDDTVLVKSSVFTRLENTNPILGKTAVSVKVDLSMSYNATGPENQYSEEEITTVALRN